MRTRNAVSILAAFCVVSCGSDEVTGKIGSTQTTGAEQGGNPGAPGDAPRAGSVAQAFSLIQARTGTKFEDLSAQREATRVRSEFATIAAPLIRELSGRGCDVLVDASSPVYGATYANGQKNVVAFARARNGCTDPGRYAAVLYSAPLGTAPSVDSVHAQVADVREGRVVRMETLRLTPDRRTQADTVEGPEAYAQLMTFARAASQQFNAQQRGAASSCDATAGDGVGCSSAAQVISFNECGFLEWTGSLLLAGLPGALVGYLLAGMLAIGGPATLWALAGGALSGLLFMRQVQSATGLCQGDVVVAGGYAGYHVYGTYPSGAAGYDMSSGGGYYVYYPGYGNPP